MRKMLIGIILLIIIMFSVSINSLFLNKCLSEIQNGLIESLSLSPSYAENMVRESFQKWEKYSRYLKVVISENRLEKISESYFACIQNPSDVIQRNKLIYEIDQLKKSEKMNIQSIF